MLTLMNLALASAWHRRLALLMTMSSIVLSVLLLLSVERLRQSAKSGFEQSVSGVDLIVGPRGSPLQLMLYSVFHMGGATNNIGWQSFKALKNHPSVEWAVPLSLGDGHRGFPVVATQPEYLTYFHYGSSQPLNMAGGSFVADVFDVVLGAEIAEELGYQLEQKIVLTHGSLERGPSHADKPFSVKGILQRTGTPVDRTLFITLEGMEAIHLDWVGGAPMPGLTIPAEHVKKFDLSPKQVTAVLVGLKSRAAVFKMQRYINGYSAEPLMAVLPGVVLSELWQLVGVVEKTLLAISVVVVIISLLGLVVAQLAGLNERRRELALLRAVGAEPKDIFILVWLESFFVSLIGIIVGVLMLWIGTHVSADWIQLHVGLQLQTHLLNVSECQWLGLILITSLIASLLPCWRAYYMSLSDGLMPSS